MRVDGGDRAGECCVVGAGNPAVHVVEDAHWIDAVSESMLADFLTVIPQTPSLVIVTYRPEYEGAVTRVHGAQP
jgi:adenylate cyclase